MSQWTATMFVTRVLAKNKRMKKRTENPLPIVLVHVRVTSTSFLPAISALSTIKGSPLKHNTNTNKKKELQGTLSMVYVLTKKRQIDIKLQKINTLLVHEP
jgi:hypothetical protein